MKSSCPLLTNLDPRLGKTFVLLLSYLVNLHGIVSYDALYPDGSKLFTDLLTLINDFQHQLSVTVEIYRDNTLLSKLEYAILGVKPILEHEDMSNDNKVKLRGFISKVNGLHHIENLVESLQKIT